MPEPLAEPVTRPGDLWILGEHRLLCDDSTKAENITKLMDGRRARLLASDPPYCIGYSGGSHPQGWAKRSPLRDKDWSADYQEGEVGSAAEFFASFISVALEQAVEEDAAFYLWHASLRQPDLFAAMRSCGLLVHQQIIWAKSRAVLTHSHYLWAHEGCLYGWSQGHMPKCRPPATATTVWEISSVIEDGAAGIHPTMKPVECFRRPILYHTSPGDVVYEPFCGSGTSIIAAEELGRVCYALELSPAFCDVSVARWERFTGRKAVRHG
jgi:DNA modification methylase